MKRFALTAFGGFALAVCLGLLAAAALPADLYAFGKNKINYFYYDWHVLETPHLRIYVASQDAALSNEIAQTAEELYAHHTNTFQYVPPRRIRLILYPNQIDFQQNNIASDWIGEATGGFTEFVKGRVVLPYAADYAAFRHILGHEMTHAFQGYVWGNGTFSINSVRDIQIPLWLIEGGAEFNSIGLDSECEMMIREGLLDNELPSLENLGDLYNLDPSKYYYVYKEGQIFYYYLEQTYGGDIFARLNRAIAEKRNLEGVVKTVFGMTLDKLNAKFFDFLRKRYYPASGALTAVDAACRKVILKDSQVNVNAVALGTNRLAFISDRLTYPSIVTYDRRSERVRRLIRGGFDEDYLEFHYGDRNNLSVSTNGVLCFVSRSGGSDVIHLFDTGTRRDNELHLPFRIINSPDISRDGDSILFSALSNDCYDIYLYRVSSGTLTALTADKYFDNQPRFIAGGRYVFTSNRKHGIGSSDLDLVVRSLDGGPETVVDTGAVDNFPSASPDGTKVVFVRNGRDTSLAVYDTRTGTVYDEFDSVGGIYSPAFTASNRVVLSAYQDNSFNLYDYRLVLTNRLAGVTVTTDTFAPIPAFSFPTNEGVTLKDYRGEFTIDNVLGAIVFNSSLGIGAMGLLEFSDTLGDHRLTVLLDTLIQIETNAWNYVNADVSYSFLKYRSDFGVRIFSYSNYFYEFSFLQSFFDTEQVYDNSYGAYFNYSYPFTTFDRLEVTAGIRGYDFLKQEVSGADTNYVRSYLNKESIRAAFVHDATLNDATGPVDGIRFEGIAEQSFAMLSNGVTYTKLVFDYRQYFMIAPGYSFAVRGVIGKILGPGKSKVPFSLGGFNSLRGYDLWSFSGDSMFLFNFEFRFPLIAYWQLGFPLPIRLPTLWGVLFWDFGSAWNDSEPWNLYKTTDGRQTFDDLKSGVGVGLRFVIYQGIKLMLDFAAPYEGYGIPDLSTWRTYFQIGVDF